jgi:1,4-dihydroxy-2-naphthoyl-CoA hydrolase
MADVDPTVDPALQKWPFSGSALNDTMGVEVLEAAVDRVVGTMPVAGNIQPFGLLHGGASCVLAETLGSIGATLHAAPDGVAVGIDINATHHRAVRDGVVTGIATPVHLGRTVACYEIVISDEQGRRVCTARLTCQVVAKPPGS